MSINALSYVRITGADLNAWESYARNVLGLIPIIDQGRLRLRLDERNYRIDVRSDGDPITVMGWDVSDERGLERVSESLENAGVTVTQGTPAEVADRDVLGLITFSDPWGLAHEVVYGQRLGAPDPRVNFTRPMGGYVTGDRGLGHWAVGVPDLNAAQAFYMDVLGFKASDIMPGLFAFLRVNPRHHSLALMQWDKAELHHLHLNVRDLEDLGRAHDKANEIGAVRKSLGQHVNDGLVSFYCATPSDWQIEYGFGGMRIDDPDWNVRLVGRPFSAWGHKPITVDES